MSVKSSASELIYSLSGLSLWVNVHMFFAMVLRWLAENNFARQTKKAPENEKHFQWWFTEARDRAELVLQFCELPQSLIYLPHLPFTFGLNRESRSKCPQCAYLCIQFGCAQMELVARASLPCEGRVSLEYVWLSLRWRWWKLHASRVVVCQWVAKLSCPPLPLYAQTCDHYHMCRWGQVG